jgi:hypothetical protein
MIESIRIFGTVLCEKIQNSSNSLEFHPPFLKAFAFISYIKKYCVIIMEVDPYYILGVSRTDTIEHITREFKKRARKVHPDKIRGGDEVKEDASRQFKLVTDAYNTIVSNNRSVNTVGMGLREQYKDYSEGNKDVIQENFTGGDLDKFNTGFVGKRATHPNDFGYGDYSRLGSNCGEDDFKGRMSEYTSFQHTPTMVMPSEKFDPREFNKLFEYNNEKVETSEERGLVYKTSDGFTPFNCGGDSLASVSSFNGLMISGDNYGTSNVGYDTDMYADYKHSHTSAKNPETITIPSDYNTKIEEFTNTNKNTNMSRQIKERELEYERLLNTKHDKTYSQQNEEFELRKTNDLKNKIENDTKFIEQYQTQYSKEVYQSAMSGQLSVSSDYIQEVDTNKSIESNFDTQSKFKLQL